MSREVKNTKLPQTDWIWARSSPMSRDGRISLQRPITRSLSAGETLTRSAAFHALSPAYDHRDVRRTSIGSSAAITRTHTHTVTLMLCNMWSQIDLSELCFLAFYSASYVPESEDQNGNFPVKVL